MLSTNIASAQALYVKHLLFVKQHMGTIKLAIIPLPWSVASMYNFLGLGEEVHSVCRNQEENQGEQEQRL